MGQYLDGAGPGAQTSQGQTGAEAKTGMIDPTTPELPAERCGNCAMSRPADDASGMLHAAGWLHCERHRAWEFVSPLHPCHFEPSRWTAKP